MHIAKKHRFFAELFFKKATRRRHNNIHQALHEPDDLICIMTLLSINDSLEAETQRLFFFCSLSEIICGVFPAFSSSIYEVTAAMIAATSFF